MALNWKQLRWLIAIVVIAAGLNYWHASQEAQTNYQNQISGCERGNPLRKGVVLALNTAAANATHGNAKYAEAVAAILAAPHVLDDGTVICERAVEQP